MTDIVERLRDLACDPADDQITQSDVIINAAADEIERLRKTVDEMALREKDYRDTIARLNRQLDMYAPGGSRYVRSA